MNQTAAGPNAVSGLRFLCGSPQCGGGGIGLPGLTPSPPPPATAAGR